MEGDIGRSHIMMRFKKVYPVAFLCLGIANKYAFERARGKVGQRRREILNKGPTSKNSRRKGEVTQGR